MTTITLSFLVAGFTALLAMSQSSVPPLSDTRLTFHTLVREDIFARLLDNDMARMMPAGGGMRRAWICA
jgi:hypothetical protein